MWAFLGALGSHLAKLKRRILPAGYRAQVRGATGGAHVAARLTHVAARVFVLPKVLEFRADNHNVLFGGSIRGQGCGPVR